MVLCKKNILIQPTVRLKTEITILCTVVTFETYFLPFNSHQDESYTLHTTQLKQRRQEQIIEFDELLKKYIRF